jgi:3-dehydroquinate synthase
VIKYGLIRDVPFLAWLEENIEGLVARDKILLAEAIAVHVKIKPMLLPLTS